MTDITINAYLARGTQAERLAMTPNPFDGMGVYFYEKDTFRLWCWDGGTWSNVNGPHVVTEASAARSLISANDSQRYLRCTNAGAVTLTLTTQADGAWGDSATVAIEQAGAGQVSVVAAAGVTLNLAASCQAKSAERYSVMQLVRTATNTWTLFGALALN